MSIVNQKTYKSFFFQTWIYFIIQTKLNGRCLAIKHNSLAIKRAQKVLKIFWFHFFSKKINLWYFKCLGSFIDRCIPLNNIKNSHKRNYLKKIMNLSHFKSKPPHAPISYLTSTSSKKSWTLLHLGQRKICCCRKIADISRSFYFIKYLATCLPRENINLIWEIT